MEKDIMNTWQYNSLRSSVIAFIIQNYREETSGAYVIAIGSDVGKFGEVISEEQRPAGVISVPVELCVELDEPFSDKLLQLIDRKRMSDIEVYKKAGIDRKLFSKIRGSSYRPGKKTVIALAVALELDLNETDDLLRHAGFALSHSVKFDVIVEFFIMQKRYNIQEINRVLLEFDQPVL